MTYEYTCLEGHSFEKFFKSFQAAAPYVDSFPCPKCNEQAKRTLSATLEPHFYGNPDGYHKPSPTKRHSTKLVNSYGNATSSA